MAAFTVHAGAATSLYSASTTTILLSSRRGAFRVSCSAADKTVVIGLAADSGCGKSTFMRRLTSVFGGTAEPPKGGNPDSNTLISDTTTVICLDDYHSLDRTGRKEKGVTALDPRANDFDLMYEQVKAIKEGQAVEKPIYNHVTGLLDPPELITPHKIIVIQGRSYRVCRVCTGIPCNSMHTGIPGQASSPRAPRTSTSRPSSTPPAGRWPHAPRGTRRRSAHALAGRGSWPTRTHFAFRLFVACCGAACCVLACYGLRAETARPRGESPRRREQNTKSHRLSLSVLYSVASALIRWRLACYSAD